MNTSHIHAINKQEQQQKHDKLRSYGSSLDELIVRNVIHIPYEFLCQRTQCDTH